MSDNLSSAAARAEMKFQKAVRKLDMAQPLKAQTSKSQPSKYTRYSTDWDALQDASHALPAVYKFFLMIYRLSPVRTGIIIAVFMIQGLLPALRLRTGGDFIRQVSPL